LLLVEFIPAASPAPVPTSDQAISGKDIFNALKQSVLSNFGDTGWGEVGASLAGVYFFTEIARD
jgi:ribonuclease P/MRP protein subunit POP5